MGNLISLVYVSSSVRELEDSEVIDILRTSRTNNSSRGITGMLLYKDGNFLQVVEGPEDVITNLMEKVERDNRHRGLIILTKRPLQERQFADWSMAFTDLGSLSEEDKAAHSSFLTDSFVDDEFRQRPDRSYKLLLHFKDSVR